MGFLDGGVSSFFSGAFSSFYLDATLFRPVAFTDDGAGGGADGSFDGGTAIKVQPEQTSQAMRDTPGYVDTDRRFFMLAYGFDEPTTDCELGFDSKLWSVVNWSKDPAGAYYDLHTRLRGDA